MDAYLQHFTKAQYFRWFQVYEIPTNEKRIANQLALFDDHITIDSPAGEREGKTACREVFTLFEGWQNAHHVSEIDIQQVAPGQLALKADIAYQCIRPTGEQLAATVHYDAKLACQPGLLLPVFTQVRLTPEPQPYTGFDQAYAENRVKSLMHYWLGLIESKTQDPMRFKEILAEDFALQFSSGLVDDMSKLHDWLKHSADQVSTSEHHVLSAKVQKTDEHTFTLEAVFDWKAVNKEEKPMRAKTRHQWVVINDPDARFARLQHMHVDVLEPFRVVEAEAEA